MLLLQIEQSHRHLLCSVMSHVLLLLRLPVGYGGVLNSPRFCFFSRVESRATAHG